MIKKINMPQLRYAEFSIVLASLEDELFSSWLIRMSYAYRTHPHTFVNQYLGYRYNSFFRRDPDVSMVPAVIEKIGHMCRDKVGVYGLTLKTFSGSLQEEITDIPNVFLCRLRFCPACLREDKVPYFRKWWRVIFYTVCLKHGCYMHERCSECGAFLDISKMYRDSKSYLFCHECGYELMRTPDLLVAEDVRYAVDIQRTILAIAERGYLYLAGRHVYSFHFFEVFVQIAKIILVKKKTRFIENISVFVLLQGIHYRKFVFAEPAYRKLAVHEQFALFAIIYEIFENFPDNLQRFIQENALTYPFMVKDMNHRPFWYVDALDKVFRQ